MGVLTQYRPLELNSYLGNGQPWDLDRSDGGVHILPPTCGRGTRGTWYKGTANAIYQNIGFLDLYDPEYVVILSGDHIYKMDYSDMVAQHKKTEAACTISVLEVTLEEATRFGIMNAHPDGQVYEFEEKPKHPKSTLASMGIYVFTWSKLREYLIADEADPNSSNDFGKNIIPNMLAAGEKLMTYRFSGYWKDVGTIDSLWDANMDLLAPRSGINLYDPSWPSTPAPPSSRPTSPAPNAVVSPLPGHRRQPGDGRVENSVLFHSVTVEEGAHVEYSILMPGAVVKAGATVSYAIVAENAVVEAGRPGGRAPQCRPQVGHRRGGQRGHHRGKGHRLPQRHDPYRRERR